MCKTCWGAAATDTTHRHLPVLSKHDGDAQPAPLCTLVLQVALPDSGDAVALIYSYEQGPQPDGAQGRIGMQAMGPGDGYIAQCTTDVSAFWASRNDLQLGACFEPTHGTPKHTVPKEAMSQVCT